MKTEIMTQQPEVSLLSITPNPLEVIARAIDVWHQQDFDVIQYSPQQLLEKFWWLLKQPHQTPFEFVHMTWIFKNVSRAFQQQLTRHRIGFSYSIQSLRVVNVGNFADEGRYTMPHSVKDKEYFHECMQHVQEQYNYMTKETFDGILSPETDPQQLVESTEDARGILPLNIHSPIMMACTYRSLIGMLKQRLCVAAQEEWSLVVTQMRKEIEKVHPILVEPLDCMCGRFSKGKSFCKTLHKEVTK